MNPLHLTIALTPVSIYLLLLGIINLRTRPLLLTGTRDTLALALAVSGFVVAGPMELFLPEAIASILGGWVWLPLIALYVLGVTLLVLMLRPRLVIYNISWDQLQPGLRRVVSQLDADARWAGEGLVMPNSGVQLHVDYHAGLRNVQLNSLGASQNVAGWRRLEQALSKALATTRVPANTHAFSFLFFALAIAALIAYSLATGGQEIAQSLRAMFRL
jgi:hypothetical protein